MKRTFIAALAAMALCASMTVCAYAGQWDSSTGQWQYRGDDGSCIVSNWVQDGGKWYYMDESGNMVAGATRSIDGMDYTFDASGVWVEEAPEQSQGPGVDPGLVQPAQPEQNQAAQSEGSWNGGVFINRSADYQLTMPNGFIDFTGQIDVALPSNTVIDVIVATPDQGAALAIAQYDIGTDLASANLSSSDLAQYMKEFFGTSGLIQSNGEITTASVGGYDYAKLPMIMYDQFNVDLYFRIYGQKVMMIESIYDSGSGQLAAGALAAITRP